MRTEEITRNVDLLLDEPLFHLMLGSRELFHSNLLAWLIETAPDTATDALSTWAVPESAASNDTWVRREWKHLDLVIQLQGRVPLVIENKAFSLPSKSQLDRYTETVNDLLAKGRLTTRPRQVLWSLVDPGWTDGTHGDSGSDWTWMSYGDLARNLRSATAPSDKFASDIVGHYASLLESLDELVSAVAVSGEEGVDLPKPLRTALRDRRLKTLVRKARIREVRRYLQEDSGTLGVDIAFKDGFTNGRPLLEGFAKAAGGHSIGWQLQGEQFRLAMILPHLKGRTEESRQRRAAVGAAHPEWFDFTAARQVLGADLPVNPNQTSGPRFLRYDPNFIYQYVKAESITASEIRDLSRHYSRTALEWVEQNPQPPMP